MPSNMTAKMLEQKEKGKKKKKKKSDNHPTIFGYL